MRLTRLVLHLVVSVAILVLALILRADPYRESGDYASKFLWFSLFPLLFAACIGLILELRRDRKAAFLNIGVPAALAGLMIFAALKFAELEAKGFELILSLIPICFAVAQGILYYMEFASD